MHRVHVGLKKTLHSLIRSAPPNADAPTRLSGQTVNSFSLRELLRKIKGCAKGFLLALFACVKFSSRLRNLYFANAIFGFFRRRACGFSGWRAQPPFRALLALGFAFVGLRRVASCALCTLRLLYNGRLLFDGSRLCFYSSVLNRGHALRRSDRSAHRRTFLSSIFDVRLAGETLFGISGIASAEINAPLWKSQH